CQKCLEKEPARRYSSADALANDLNRFLRGEPVSARRATAVEHGVKWTRRNPAWASLLVVVVLATALLILGLTISNARIRAERDRVTASESTTREYAYCADMRLAQDA